MSGLAVLSPSWNTWNYYLTPFTSVRVLESILKPVVHKYLKCLSIGFSSSSLALNQPQSVEIEVEVEGLLKIFEQCPNIVAFCLAGRGEFQAMGRLFTNRFGELLSAFKEWTQLEHLDLSEYKLRTNKTVLNTIYSVLPNLRSLKLNDYERYGDDPFQNCPLYDCFFDKRRLEHFPSQNYSTSNRGKEIREASERNQLWSQIVLYRNHLRTSESLDD